MILDRAGEAGLDPGPFSLRDLCRLAEAAQKERWNHTAQVIAILVELQRDRKKRSRPFTLIDFHPFHKPRPGENPPGLTKSVLRERARAWFAAKGLPCPQSLSISSDSG